MAETTIEDALQGAQVVKAREIGGTTTIQVWYGGVQVTVYHESHVRGQWIEQTVWTASDRKGRPKSETEIRSMIEMSLDKMEERFEEGW